MGGAWVPMVCVQFGPWCHVSLLLNFPRVRPQASRPVLSMDLWPPSSAWKGGQLCGHGPGLAPVASAGWEF